ncbi:MAG: PEF-CTERM sorting domain-containing protein [Euryarchaeota archaeon]|nr:PEF-CTERM sorting domain-containing protein [Euryarchaeota archaeon]
MKLKYIIGILVGLISLTGTALATDYYAVLDDCSVPGGEEKQHVTASVSGNVVTFRTQGINPTQTGWFYMVGLPDGVEVVSVTDKYNGKIHPYYPYNILNYPRYWVYSSKYLNTEITLTKVVLYHARVLNIHNPDRFSEIHVTLKEPLTDPAPTFGARVDWVTQKRCCCVPCCCPITCACFMGTGTTTNTPTQVPEFPTIALPVAAMLGLIFIFGRKKEE